MTEKIVYCIVDEKGDIQRGTGSSKQTKFFEKPIQPQKWCDYNNEYHGKHWRVAKFRLVEES